MGITFGPGMVRALEERLAEVTAERDHLRDAIEDIPRHEVDVFASTRCHPCMTPWPCPTERAHIAATQSTASAEDRAATDGAGSRLPHGEGPHDADVAPAGVAEGTLPAPKDDNKEAMP